MTVFSRGPWKVVGQADNHQYVCSVSGKAPICLALKSKERTPQQDAANLALILDAPAMHKALGALIDAVEGRGDVTVEAATALAKSIASKHQADKAPAPLKLVDN